MSQYKWQNVSGKSSAKSLILTGATLAIFAASAFLSYYTTASAQFIDRITRPCANGSGRSLVQTTPTDVIINSCAGAQVLINGMPFSGGGSPGGLNTQVQFNDSGAFGGDAGFTYNKTTDTISLGGNINLAATAIIAFGSNAISYTNAAGPKFFDNSAGFSLTLDLQNLNANRTLIAPDRNADLATTTGTLTNGRCVQIDATGNLVQAAAACSAGTVTGTGATNKLVLWLNGAGGILGDSPITASSNNVSLAGELTAPFTIRTGTASNTDVAGSLTVGAGGTITYTFTQAYATAPVCTTSDTNAAPMISGASTSTTTLTLTGTVGHVLTYHCFGLN